MTHSRRLLLVALASFVLLVANGPGASAAEPKSFFVVGTGSAGGLYYPVGQAICRLLARLSLDKPESDPTPSLRCSAQPSGGSENNVNQLAAGEFDFAIVQSDVDYAAYSGSHEGDTPAFNKLRAVFSLHAEPFHLVVGKNSGITKFADLRGKRVNIGNPGSGQREMMSALMKQHKMTVDDFAAATEMPGGPQAEALCRGEIDAFVYVIGMPDGGVARATDECGARLVPVQDEQALALVKNVPGYELVTIPRGMYASTTADVPTIGVVATLVTSADQDPDLVYAVTKTVMQHLSEIRGFHPALANLKPETMIRKGITIPLHPGAQRYFQERGWKTDGVAAGR